MPAVREEPPEGELVEAVVVVLSCPPRLFIAVLAVVGVVAVVHAHVVEVGRVRVVEDLGLVRRGLLADVEVEAGEERVGLDVLGAADAAQPGVGVRDELPDQVVRLLRALDVVLVAGVAGRETEVCPPADDLKRKEASVIPLLSKLAL